MKSRIIKALFKTIIFCILIFILFTAGYIITSKIPMQRLKITASTTANEFDISGKTNLYYFEPLSASNNYKAVIKFMAVKNTSENVFTSHGKGQYIYLGCSELKAECGFISLGRFLCVQLTLNASQTELKLEDGTPYDITQYSLKPVITIED